MFKIYCIEDINGLRYIGRTADKRGLNSRYYNHKNNKRNGVKCSSSKLDLENSTITVIDTCDTTKESIDLEWFYINTSECVNIHTGNYNHKDYKKEYDIKNSEKQKLYRLQNKERKKQYDKKRRAALKDLIQV